MRGREEMAAGSEGNIQKNTQGSGERNRESDRKAALAIASVFPKQEKKLEELFFRAASDFPQEGYCIGLLWERFSSFMKEEMGTQEKWETLIRAASELTSAETPNWEFIAARIKLLQFQEELEKRLREYDVSDFYEKVRWLTEEGLYVPDILEGYSREEIQSAEAMIDEERDFLFTFSGLDLLLSRYVIRSRKREILETPQEMYLGIALHLALKEKRDERLFWVKRFYDMMSLQQVTMATPTLSNARKPFHQLSSCFIDTVPDSLEGIYRSVDNFAMVSKFGGGMGLYFGKVRAAGSSIRGFEGAAGGVIRWIRLVNDTAVAVDQLGMRQGAAAVYLDAWHRDLPEFLQLRTNNGDERMKAHDVFPAICYPDLFWRMAEKSLDSDWHLMCPHQIWTVKGYHLEDFYGEEWEKRYLDCVSDPNIEKRTVVLKDLMRMILKSAVETGTPFIFNRDHVNRMNPNSHAGMIYASNLCTEIAQNMSPMETKQVETVTEDGDTVVVTHVKAGDFVVCNLASLSLGHIPVEDEGVVEQIVESAVRALDNVIDLNLYPLPYAAITNSKYRGIGLGVSGYHHMLAKRNIRWESEEHLAFADQVFETINYAAVKASCGLARERGSYSAFLGSDWETGAYFEKRGYLGGRWEKLRKQVKEHGLRNGYLLAVAPTSSTSILSGTTAGLDPVMRRFFLEEKKHAILPRVAPELSMRTFWYYKEAHLIDQTFTVRAAGIRQRHIDQSQSVNLYITNEYTLRQVMNLFITAWREGVKTLYYLRSKSLEVEECESCSS